jgi:hypothetical protein
MSKNFLFANIQYGYKNAEYYCTLISTLFKKLKKIYRKKKKVINNMHFSFLGYPVDFLRNNILVVILARFVNFECICSKNGTFQTFSKYNFFCIYLSVSDGFPSSADL